MSPRCQVAIEGSPVLVHGLYHGAPDTERGVLATLLPLRDRFWASRGRDESDFLAQLLVEWGNLDALLQQPAREDAADRGITRPVKTLARGVSVDAHLHGDIDYLYYVRRDGTVEVYRPRFSTTAEQWSLQVGQALADGKLKLESRHLRLEPVPLPARRPQRPPDLVFSVHSTGEEIVRASLDLLAREAVAAIWRKRNDN